MHITWLGHSTFKIKAEGMVIYIDPYAGENELYTPAADIILVSHSHADHCDGQKIKKIRVDSTFVYTPEEIVYRFNSTKLELGKSFIVGRIRITPLKAYNIDKANHSEDLGFGFLIEAEGKKIYFAGDTDLIPEMDNLHVDIAFLPVGGTYTMDYEEAAQAAMKVHCRLAIPMHYGYGLVGRLEDAEMFKEIVEREGIRAEILKVGKDLDL